MLPSAYNKGRDRIYIETIKYYVDTTSGTPRLKRLVPVNFVYRTDPQLAQSVCHTKNPIRWMSRKLHDVINYHETTVKT
jgi:hypothetical protein